MVASCWLVDAHVAHLHSVRLIKLNTDRFQVADITQIRLVIYENIHRVFECNDNI